ncbi:hypothetical protein AB0K60_16795 [Thermopolyspora sp. NPDC052614]|uniref:hypothetical protein n=1 Tax=Thermopolyspora sp. NPDC052614 TaxID=3155682 RepID=UPI00342B031C
MKKPSKGFVKILYAFIGTATLLSAVAVGVTMLGSADISGANDIHPVHLLADMKDLPEEPFIRFQSAAATISPLTEHFGADHFGSNGYAQRGWGVHRNEDLLLETVLRYANGASAKAESAAAPYGRIFNDPIYLDHIQKVDLAEADLIADSAAMGCVNRYPDRRPQCLGWAFGGRYGNYVVEITYNADRDPAYKRGLEQEVFLDLVKAMDRHIAKLNIN